MQNHSSEPLAQTAARLTKTLEQSAGASADMLSRLSRLARRCDQIVEEMDFSFLFDVERKLFTIGYNVTASRADESYYDLLASEARLASFVGIAKGDVPQQHWFRMGRTLTKVDGGRALISWTGTMFEYLMPLLVMRNYQATLLSETYRTIVDRQIEYGDERGVPWGISEAAYNVRDLQFNYQYGPFGVPGLGLKRGLIEDVVVAPYASMLAAEINPDAAMKNLRRLQKEGALGPYGFYESIDYTAERLPEGQKSVLIRAFMTHHQGMSLVSLANVLQEDLVERRFHADPSVQATELLLQERIPVGVPASTSACRRGFDWTGRADFARDDHARLRKRRLQHAAHPTAVERNIQRDGNNSGFWLFTLRGERCHALARRCDAGQLGFVYLPARCTQRCSLVCRSSTCTSPAAVVSRCFLRRQGRLSSR